MDEAIGYIRKSKRDQSHYSLEYQERSIREYCKRNNVELKALFVDDGESSYTFDRPDYIALEKFIKSHKNSVRYLIVLDHDRFSRNLPEALIKIEHLEKTYRLKVLATNESLDIDTSDPMVFMQRAFKYLVANQELFTIRKRAKLGLRQAQMSGRYVNMAPYGYTNEKKSDKTGVIQINESEAFIVRKIFNDYILGIPEYLIYKDVVKIGFPHRGNGAVSRILKNPLYGGLVRVTGTEKEPEHFVKGLHKGIVPEDLFWQAYEKINDKRSMKIQPNEEFPLKGILKSPCCGGNMTAGWSKGKSKYFLYYRCIKHSNVNIPGKILHEKFHDLLHYLSFSNEQVEYITKTVRSALEESGNAKARQLQVANESLKKLESQLERTEQKFINDEINKETYDRWLKKSKIEGARLKAEIKELKDGNGGALEQKLSLIPELLDLERLFSKAGVSEKHALLNVVFKHGLTYREGVFRTPGINPVFNHNLLIIKEKGLLEVEQSHNQTDEISSCAKEEISNFSFLFFAVIEY